MIRVVFVAFISLISFFPICSGQSLEHQAISLNGINQYIRVPQAVYHNQAGTIEMWFKSTGEGQGRNPLFGGNGGQNAYMPGLFMDRGDLFWEFGDRHSQPTFISLRRDRWYHIAFTYEKKEAGYQIAVWLNGESVSKGAGILFAESWLQEIHFGHYLAGPTDYFKGEIDEIRLWSFAKDQAQIRQSMCQSAAPTDDQLLLYLTFEEEDGIVVEDASGHHIVELKQMSGEERTMSGAAIGNASSYLYPPEHEWEGERISLFYNQSEQVEISNILTQSSGLHLYRTGESNHGEKLPDGYEPSLASGVYRIFVVGEDAPAFTMTMSQALAPERAVDNRLRMLQTAAGKNEWEHNGAFFRRNQQSVSQGDCHVNMAYAMGFRKDSYEDQPGAGSSLWFDGKNDLVISSLEASSHAVYPLTFECWFRTSRIGSRQVLLELGAEASLTIGIQPDGSLFAKHNRAEGEGIGKIEAENWYHLAYAHDMGTNEGLVYLNGRQLGTIPVDVGLAMKEAIHLGGEKEAFFGYMDEVRFWSEYLHPDTIRQWMVRKLSPAHPSYQNLMLHYAFDEDEGDLLMIEDKAGPWDGHMLGMDGTINRFGSQVPLGDEARMFEFPFDHPASMQLGHIDGDQLSISHLEGKQLPEYLYLYRVDQQAKVEDGYFMSKWSDRRYWGIHMVGASEDIQYDIAFSYAGYPVISSEAGLTLASRNSPNDPVWYNTFAELDMHKDQIHVNKGGNLEFVLGEGFPFSVNWEEVTAQWKSYAVEVSWEIGIEESVSQYAIERSADGRMFSTIALLSPDSSVSGHYQYADSSVIHTDASRWYYRVRQGDVQGNVSHSEIVEVERGASISFLTLAPNPTDSDVSVLLPAQRTGMGSLRLLDMQGRVLEEKLVSPSLYTLTLDLRPYPVGNYLVQLLADDQIWGEMLRKN
ncbi:MAG: LamG-like jellyroll fold domain-containing protein [Bacteroidota bacterium]